jgi:uncharacterized protein YbbK (DUF523 family)
MTDRNYLRNLRKPTIENPLRILTSACLLGVQCGYDSSSYGQNPGVLKLLDFRNVQLTSFCPEEFSFGSPREVCDIYGGDGLDVLEGKAKVLTPSGQDWTKGMIRASERMLEIAKKKRIELAILMDISAACGSQVVYDGSRLSDQKKYQVGMGVCAAQLKQNGFQIISQRDFASLEILYSRLEPGHPVNEQAVDHHETPWYQEYFK